MTFDGTFWYLFVVWYLFLVMLACKSQSKFEFPSVRKQYIFRVLNNFTYSDLPNYREASFSIFWKKNHLHTLSKTRLLISEICPSKPDFHLHKWEKKNLFCFWEIYHQHDYKMLHDSLAGKSSHFLNISSMVDEKCTHCNCLYQWNSKLIK